MSENQVNLNIKSQDDINNYIEAHKNDFKQIFFKPDTNNINSSLVGVLLVVLLQHFSACFYFK